MTQARDASPTDDDLAALCKACGLCCDGSLFGRARLEPEEVESARRNHLRVLESGNSFEQPCSVLRPTGDGGHVCSVYEERPLTCHRFACRLYDRHRRDGGPLEPRLAAVRRVRELLAYLETSVLKPIEIDEPRVNEPIAESLTNREKGAFEELVRRLDEDFARA